MQYAASARDDLQRLDKAIASRIMNKLDRYVQQEHPLKFSRRFKDSPYGEYRFRIGDYRILFDIDAYGQVTILVILRIRHRREVYD